MLSLVFNPIGGATGGGMMIARDTHHCGKDRYDAVFIAQRGVLETEIIVTGPSKNATIITRLTRTPI